MADVQALTESQRTIIVDLSKIRNASSPSSERSSDEIVIVADDEPLADPSPDDLLQCLRQNPYMNPDNSIYELIRQSEYLQQYPSWLGFCGPEKKKKFPPTFIARNDTIWELIFTERGYMDMLLMVRDLYMLPFPNFEADQSTGNLDGAKLRAALFPGLDSLIEAHERILRLLLAAHDQSPDHVVRCLGSCLVHLLDQPTRQALSKLYGGFMFAQRRIREQLQLCKHIPAVALFFEKCRQDRRSARRSLEDCHMVIVQHWTKVETLLDAIIKNTLNHPSEVENLEATKKAVRNLLKDAEAVMVVQEHAEKLAEFCRRFSSEHPDDPDDTYVRTIMKQPSTTLVNYGLLRVSVGQTLVEVVGVALNECFFVLQKSTEAECYHLFRESKMPPVLRWGQVYGYFRRAVIKGGFGFFILLQAESVLTLFQCNTIDELNRWEATINEGFAKWDVASPCTMEDLDAEWQHARESMAERWRNTEVVFALLSELDADLARAWKARTFVSRVLIEERLNALKMENSSQITDSSYLSASSLTACTRSHIECESASPVQPLVRLPNITPADSVDQKTFYSGSDTTEALDQILVMFRELFVRLQFALLGSTACLSRSASDVEERKRPQLKSLKKNETFSGRDISKPSFDLKSMSERKSYSKKRDSNRISSTMANLFRGGSREKSVASSTDGSAPSNQSSLSQLKSSLQRPSTATLNVSSATTGSRTSLSSTSGTSPTPNLAARPSLTVLPGSMGEHPLQSGSSVFNPCDSNNGSCNSLSSRPSAEALNLLRDLTELAEDFLPSVFDLRTENDELSARIRYLESEKSKLEDIHTRAKQLGFLKAVNTGSGGHNSTDLTSSDNPSTFSVKQETEKLRQDVENFRKRSEEWDKEYKRQRDALERDHAKLAKEWTRYDEAKADLERRQHQYDESRKTLQQQLDLYAKQGVRFTGIILPDLQLPCDNVGLSVPVKDVRRGSSSSLADLSSLSSRTDGRSISVHMHMHSTSDDLTGQWARPTGLFKDSRSRESTAPLDTTYNDATPRPSLIPAPATRSDELPVHLRGSLVNQPIVGKPPAASSPINRPSHASSENPASSTSALYKLADSSKPQSSVKQKKPNIFRRS